MLVSVLPLKRQYGSGLLADIQTVPEGPTIIIEDNQGAI